MVMIGHSCQPTRKCAHGARVPVPRRATPCQFEKSGRLPKSKPMAIGVLFSLLRQGHSRRVAFTA
jgi:hypothetical protein